MAPSEILPAASFVATGATSGDLSARARSVLDELARAQGGRVAFQALRRRLGLHPQALTRTLRRLESTGIVAREDSGYQLRRDVGAGSPDALAPTQRFPVFAAVLPSHLVAAQVVERLRHRWFQGLRWFGIGEGPEETVLSWTAETGGRLVRLRVTDAMVGVELEGAQAEGDPALIAPLMQALAVLYGRGASPARLSGPAR